MSSSDLVGSRGSSCGEGDARGPGRAVSGLRVAPCGRAWRPWGRPYPPRGGSRSSSWRVAKSVGAPILYASVLRTPVRDFFISCVSCKRKFRLVTSHRCQHGGMLFGLVTCPAAPLAVSFAPGLLGPAASAGPLLRRMREVGVTHLAAVPQSDATVQHCADMYAVAQSCHVRSTRAHLLCTVRTCGTGQLGAQLPREVPVLHLRCTPPAVYASPGSAGGAGAARERRPRRHHQPVADWRAGSQPGARLSARPKGVGAHLPRPQ